MENLVTDAQRQPIVRLTENGEALADSRDVAAFFGKRHTEVIRAIRDLVSKEPTLGRRNFASFKINDLTGESTSHFEMDKRGFTVLAMGFTGDKALKWKLRYIDAFELMEAELRSRALSNRPVDASMIDISAEVRKVVGGIVKAVVHSELASLIGELLPAAVRSEIASSGFAVRCGKTAGQIWHDAGYPRMKITRWFGDRLAKFDCQIDGNGRGELGMMRARLFDPDKAERWLKEGGGDLLVEQKIAERQGQRVLKLVRS